MRVKRCKYAKLLGPTVFLEEKMCKRRQKFAQKDTFVFLVVFGGFSVQNDAARVRLKGDATYRLDDPGQIHVEVFGQR